VVTQYPIYSSQERYDLQAGEKREAENKFEARGLLMLEGSCVTLFPVVKLFPPNGGVKMGEAPLKSYTI